MRAEEKLVCAMPSAAEFREAKNSGCRLAGRHLLCSQVAGDILRSLRGLPLAVCRKCLGRQRLAALKHVSGLPAHCSTCSLRLRNADICFTKFGCARCVTCKQACVTLAGTNFRPWRRITFAAVNHSESNSRSNLLKTALYERELLLAANEEKERGMFERWESSVAWETCTASCPVPDFAA